LYNQARASADVTRSEQNGAATRTPRRALSSSYGATAWSGNQTHLRHLANRPSSGLALQRKLSIGKSSDPLELEADRTADLVMRMPAGSPAPPAVRANSCSSSLLRKCSCGGTCNSCSSEYDDSRYNHAGHGLQRMAAGPISASEAPPVVHEVLRSSGQPLDHATRAFFEPRFGRDFSNVRIHTGTRAAASARQVNALAYTVGNDVAFGSAQFAPTTGRGQHLLAHELAHVVQQSRSTLRPSALRRAENPYAPTPAKDQSPVSKPARVPDLSNGCFGRAVNGRGWVKSVGATHWVLSNFDIDQHYIKKEHFDFLKNTVVPKINATAPGKYLVMVIGEASTTADFAYNLDLSNSRANCVAQELRAAGLDDDHRVNIITQTGELRGDIEQLLQGIDPRKGIEDSSKRMVTILLVPSGPCTTESRTRASHTFYAKVACSSKSSIRINIGVDDSVQPIYREFSWLHDPWPHGCTFIPEGPRGFGPHYEFVQASMDLRLASRDPDQIYAPSDFLGDLTFFGYGANSYLIKGPGFFYIFKIGLGGKWNPESCGTKQQTVGGTLIPLGPVRCGWAPDPPAGKCKFVEEECSDAHKMAASKSFNGHLEGATFSLKGLLDPLIKKLPSWAQSFVKPGGAVFRIKFGTKDSTVDPSLTRSFVFVAGGNQGGGSFTEHLKAAVAPTQNATKPSRLATENPDSALAHSDLSEPLGKLVIYGASNKISLKTGAGTFNFFNFPFCNHGGTRTYYGALLPSWAVNCPDSIDLPELKERECKDEEDCPESTRTAGHRQFTVKVGRATLASLPLVGQALAKKLGCRIDAAFVNIQSEDGPKEKQIHREFLVVFSENGCRFTVAKAHASISEWLSRQLATNEPDDILAASDFTPGARLSRDGDLSLISLSNFPVKFKLPGFFDPTCKVRSGGVGFSVPISAVDCGPAPEPIHDTTSAVNHTDGCNRYKQEHFDFVDTFIQTMGEPDYQAIFAKMSVGAGLVPPDEYHDYIHRAGQTISPAVFLGLAPNPQGGPPIQVVAFADLRIIRVTPNKELVVQFLSDVCAFDEFGNVVLLRPQLCNEGWVHAFDTGILVPAKEDETVQPPERHKSETQSVQRKLAIGSSSDPLEAEADRAADHILGSSASDPVRSLSNSISSALRRCSCGGTCDKCRSGNGGHLDDQDFNLLQRKPTDLASTTEAPEVVHQELLAPGQPLDEDTRALMEPRLHHDLSDVRIHTSDHAAVSARAVSARAYTVGNHIVFGAGEYSPATSAGRRLLAHELAHVVQQRAASPTLQRQPKPKTKAVTPAPRKDYVFIMGEDEKKSRNPFFEYAKLYFQSHLPQATFVEDKRTFTDLLDWISVNVTEPIGNLYIVSHGNENGTLFFGLNASSKIMTVIDLRNALHPSGGGGSTLTSVSSVIDAQTRIHIKGCDIGRTKEIVELIDEAFGGKGTVTAPTHEQRYEADPYLGAQARQQAHDKDIADFTSKLSPLPDDPAPIDRSLKGDARKQAKKEYDDANAARRKAQAERAALISAEEKRIKPELDTVEAKAKTIDLLTGPMFQRPGTTLFDLNEIQPQVDKLYSHLSVDQRKSLARKLVTLDRGNPMDQQGQKIERLTHSETFNEPANVDEAIAVFGKSFRADHFIPRNITSRQTGDTEPKVIYSLSGVAHPPGSKEQEWNWNSDAQPIPDETAVLATGKAKVNNPDRFHWRVERKHAKSGVTTLTVVAERVIAYLHHGSLDAKPHEHFTKPEDNPDFYTTSTFTQPSPPKKK
jgi:outer membrane protein OmpA-like peptidoglycan-associated protein